MSKTQKVTIKSPDGKEVWAPCATCSGETAHVCLSEVDIADGDEQYDVQGWWQYYIVQCGGCKKVSFCVEKQFSEDWDHDRDGNMVAVNHQRVYPGRLAGRPLIEDMYSIPHGVAQIYTETHEAISNNQAILTGIGLRAIIEAVCSDKNTTERNLDKKINELNTLGVLTQEGAQTLHKIRLLGNAAAHEAKANTQEELFAAFEVVEHLLRSVYVIPYKAKRLDKNP
jgi:alkylhydroperoxidase/carboxymuconolactone decarboxylase family protein YurZ